MEILPIKTRVLVPPQDDLRGAIRASDLALREGDCIAITSKVVSIGEGRCVPIDQTDPTQRDTLARREATLYLAREHVPHELSLFTLAHHNLISGAGIDASNAGGHFVLWPKDPHASAERLREWCMQTYNLKTLYLIITDSRSLPLRRGAVGFALAWAGFDPLVDHTTETDLFGRTFTAEHTNLADALASTAVLAMGETNACTPLAIIRNAPYLARQSGAGLVPHAPPYEVPTEEDLFAPFLKSVPWKKGGADTK